MGSDEAKISLYKRVNGFTGPLARTRHHWRTRLIARLLANYSWLRNKGKKQHSLTAMAEEWRRMFGLDRFWRITKVEDETVHAEIHFPCSLEGTGDLAACHRLMEYDRALLDKIGGQLVVLESRADPAVSGCCKVAIVARDRWRRS
jgi:hypothetical protein